RTIIPGLIVDAVVVEPWGAHPSYVQGAYDRDNRFYLDWDPISRDEAATQAWLDEWVRGVSGRADYLEKLGADRGASLRPSGGARRRLGRGGCAWGRPGGPADAPGRGGVSLGRGGRPGGDPGDGGGEARGVVGARAARPSAGEGGVFRAPIDRGGRGGGREGG